MPWVLEETFAAGGLDLHSEVTLRRLDPLYRIHWAGEEEHFDFADDPARLRAEVAKFSARDAAQVEPFLAALAPIYRDGILAAGRRPFLSAAEFARLVPSMVRLDALRPLHSFVSRFFTHPRVREAFSFHSLFIGGDPYRVPAIYGALVHLQVAEGGWYADGGVYSVVEAMARPLDVRCGEPAEAIEHAAGRVTGVRLAGGERIARRRRRLQRRRAAHPRARRPPPAAAPPARDDVVLPALPRARTGRSSSCGTTRCWSATATRSSSAP